MSTPPLVRAAESSPAPLSNREWVGRALFFDANLSEPPGQSCASCHDPNFAFTDPDKWVPTSEGASTGVYGKRNTPTAMYLDEMPPRQFITREGVFFGGLFVDGRVDTLEQQAQAPLLNAAEMANPDKQTVVAKVRDSAVAGAFRKIYGRQVFDNVDQAFDGIVDAIAAFERTFAFRQYSSKYDAVLAGRAELTADELDGLFWFTNKCASCHPVTGSGGKPPMFSDFRYHNLGIPANPGNRFASMPPTINPDGAAFVDKGLGGSLADPLQDGKFRTPTLRNIALTGPYMHNGWFNTLTAVVDFYNTRDRKPPCVSASVTEDQAVAQGCWPAAEVHANLSTSLGRMDLSSQQVNHIVAFMKTLTDGWRASMRF